MRLKHIISTVFFFAVAFTLWQCDGDDPNAAGPACNISNADLTYDKNMKSLINRTCLSCHAGKGPGTTDYSTYEKMQKYLDNGDILKRVVIDKDMPQAGSPMTQAQRDSMNCWLKAGSPK